MNKIMKRIFKILTLIAGVVFISSCTKEMMDYSGPESIYFAVRDGNKTMSSTGWPYVPYTNVEFVKTTADTIVANVLIRATGETKPYERRVDLEVIADSSSALKGQHYHVPQSVTLGAGLIETFIPVSWFRTPDMKLQEMRLQIKLVANEHFSLIFKSWDNPKELTSGTVYNGFDASRHNLICSDILVKPSNWLGSFDATTKKEKSAFGAFSPKKFLLIQSLMGYSYSDFMSSETMTIGLQYAISRYMSNYLVAKYKAKEPVLEDDGRLMWFEYCPWSTFEGVPWDGVYVEY